MCPQLLSHIDITALRMMLQQMPYLETFQWQAWCVPVITIAGCQQVHM